MSEIKQLKTRDHDQVKSYLYKHFWSCIEIIKAFEKCGIKQDFVNKDAGIYYGYFYEDALEGLLVFTNNKKVLFHYSHEDFLKKVDVLKAIRHHRPEYLTGVTAQVKSIWKMFERTVKRYNYKESSYMIFEASVEATKPALHEIRPAVLRDANYHMPFFLNVEKHFGRKHMTTNQLKDRIQKRLNTQEYLVAETEGHLIGQGFVEEKIHAFWQIGGVYTSPAYRGQGLGRSMMSALITTIKDQGCVPILAVLKDNSPAINLYKIMGFNTVIDYSILELEF